jgi:DNA-binding YbaB/EbfC family protein
LEKPALNANRGFFHRRPFDAEPLDWFLHATPKGALTAMAFNMKALQQMQQKMLKMQEEFANSTFEGTAGGGVVSLTLKGTYELQGIKISPEAVDPEDVESLEDLILAAAHDAFEKARAQQEKMLGGVMGGMKIPGMF